MRSTVAAVLPAIGLLLACMPAACAAPRDEVAAPSSEETLLAAARADADAGDTSAACSKLGELCATLESLAGGVRTRLQSEILEKAAGIAFELEATALARSAFEARLEDLRSTEPEDDPAVLRVRMNLASVAKAEGDLQGARRIQEEVAAIYERTLPPDDATLQKTRVNLANTLDELGDVEGARALLERALEVLERILPPDHRDLLVVRMNLGNVLTNLGEFEAARTLQARVLEERLRSLPEDHLEVCTARMNLGATIRELGDLGGAREQFERVHESCARTLPEDHPTLRAARLNLALSMEDFGDFAGALRLVEGVVASYERALPPDHPALQRARSNYACTLLRIGDPRRAREIFESVLEVRVRTLPEDHLDVQETRSNLATVLADLGELAPARSLQEQLLASYARTLPSDHPYVIQARATLATIVKSLGDLSDARAIEEEVLQALLRARPADHREVQRARSNLAGTLFRLGENERACAHFAEVAESFARTLPDDHPDLLLARGNLAAALHTLGDLEGARALGEQVLEGRLRTLPDDHSDVQAARVNLAGTLRGLGDLARSRTLEGQALEVFLRTFPEDNRFVEGTRWNIATGIARQALAEGDPEARRSEYGAAVRDYASGLRLAAARALASASGREAEERVSREGWLDKVLSLTVGYGAFAPDADLDETAFLVSEATRSVAILSSRVARLARPDPAWNGLRDRLRDATGRMAALSRDAGSPEELTAARAELEAAQRELVRLGRSADPGAMDALDADLAGLSAPLAEGDALVAYRGYDRGEPSSAWDSRWVPSLCVFVLRAGPKLARVELGPIEPIEGAIEAWRSSLGSGAEAARGLGVPPRSGGDDRERGLDVRRIVLDPLADELRGAERLVILPDDVLHLVPFDALPAHAAPREYLGDELRIEVRSSWLESLDPREESPRGEDLVAVGGVDYGAPDRDFRPLPGADDEARGVAALFRAASGAPRSTELLDGANATRERFVLLAPGASWLHVATHGWFAPPPEDSEVLSPMLLAGIALAGANLSPDAAGNAPGLVTAEEISALDFAGCKLAVLSACDTNVGLRRAGQGVASLQKALHMAGARSVISSLWKVPDEATKELMLDFYRRIWVEKKPMGQALWEAKRKLREAKDERGVPMYSTRDWSAWVLTGDAR